MRNIKFLTVAAVILLLTSYAMAEVPQMINYQGHLTNASGESLDTLVSMTFTIYDDTTGQAILWQETQDPVEVIMGGFSVLLGSVNPIVDSVFEGDSCWLGVTIGEDEEISPLTPLGSIPFAFRVSTVDRAYGGAIIGSLEISNDTSGAYLKGIAHPGDPAIRVGGLSGPTVKFTPAQMPVHGSIHIKDDAGNTTVDLYGGDGGKVGIGTDDPGQNLHIVGGFRLENGSQQNGYVLISDELGVGTWGPVSGLGWNWQDSSSHGPDSVLYADSSAYAAFADSAGAMNAADIGSGTLSDDRLSENVSKFGSSIESGEIQDGTIQLIDIGQNGAADGQIMKWNQTANAWEVKDTDWELGTSNNDVLFTKGYWGIARKGNTLFGSNDYTHVNLGVTCTTGTVNQSYENATVGGGRYNAATGTHSTVDGGYYNRSCGVGSSISGGVYNSAEQSGSTVGGGYGNAAMGSYSTVGGGWWDTASSTGSTVGGGYLCLAMGGWSTVGGGDRNRADGEGSTVSGGGLNNATGNYSAVPGGKWNTALGYCSFAIGNSAKANHDGAIVIAATPTAPAYDSIRSGGEGQLVLRAKNCIYITRGSGVAPYDVTKLINTSTGAHLTAGGVWTNASDKRLKENFAPINGAETLEKISQLSINRWNYKNEDESITHIGPDAQDFYRLFQLGNDDKSISTIDPAGIALVAVKELYKRNQELEAEVSKLEELVRQLLDQKK